MFVVGILLGEPEYIDPLKLEAPEGMLVTGYPLYDIKSPAHQDWVARYTKRGDKTPVLGSLIGYVTYQSVADAIKKAGSTDTAKLVAAFKGLKVETPIGPLTLPSPPSGARVPNLPLPSWARVPNLPLPSGERAG